MMNYSLPAALCIVGQTNTNARSVIRKGVTPTFMRTSVFHLAFDVSVLSQKKPWKKLLFSYGKYSPHNWLYTTRPLYPQCRSPPREMALALPYYAAAFTRKSVGVNPEPPSVSDQLCEFCPFSLV